MLSMAPAELDASSDDYYKVLGVERTAGDADIGRAYKKLALKHHPDKNLDDKQKAEAVFKKISEAYSVLSDPEKRRSYDQFGKVGAAGAPGAGFAPGAGGGLSSEQAEALFRAVLGGMTGGGAKHAGNAFGMHMDMDEMLAGVFQGLGGGVMGSPGRPRAPPRQPEYAVPTGTAVFVRGLERSAEYNGKVGRVLRFDRQRARYDVSLDGNTLSLRPQNLMQQCEVEILGLESKTELNGKVGDVVSFNDATGRYMVLLQSPPVAISLQRKNCILKEGTRVMLEGLASGHYNGQMAIVLAVHHDLARYTVRCENGEEIKVKYDKVAW